MGRIQFVSVAALTHIMIITAFILNGTIGHTAFFGGYIH